MKLKSLLAGVALLGLQTGAASAAVVPLWNWDSTSQFVPGFSTFTTGINTPPGPGTIENTAARISWGSSSGSLDPAANTERSGVAWTTPLTKAGNQNVGNQLQTGILVPGPFQAGSSVTHFNNAIASEFATLTGGRINTVVNLYVPPTTAPGAATHVVTRNFDFQFVETPNAGPCVIGQPDCADIFVLTAGAVIELFNFDNQDYLIQVGAFINNQNAFQALPHAVCNFAQIGGSGAPLETECQDANFQPFGFTTPEDLATLVQFAFAIQTVAIPEPSALALFGIALVGLGFASRWRWSA